MAKRNSTRRKARTPKLIEVAGHQLTEAMHAEYLRCIESRAASVSSGVTAAQIERLGLSDFLVGYRPSKKITRQLIVLSCMASRTALAIGAMDTYTFYADEPAAIRSAGCKLLRELAQDLSNSAAVVSALATGVEAEAGTKLQDWLAQAEMLKQKGCSKEFAHGNC